MLLPSSLHSKQNTPRSVSSHCCAKLSPPMHPEVLVSQLASSVEQFAAASGQRRTSVEYGDGR